MRTKQIGEEPKTFVLVAAQNRNSKSSCIRLAGWAATACPKNGELITPI
jgi:hypothetical protein